MELGLGASFPLWRAPSIPCAPAGTGHCPVGVWAAWKRLMEWLKDPLGMWQHSRARVAVTCFGTSWHPRPAEQPQGCLTCTAPVTEPPGHPALSLGPRGGWGALQSLAAQMALSIPCSPSSWHICPHRAVWGCSGSPSALRAPGSPQEDLWGWEWAVLHGTGCLALPDSRLCSPCSSPNPLPGRQR